VVELATDDAETDEGAIDEAAIEEAAIDDGATEDAATEIADELVGTGSFEPELPPQADNKNTVEKMVAWSNPFIGARIKNTFLN
jgi:hypothetical protein